MRNLFLALLLANLLFLGWRVWIAPPQVPARQLMNRGPEPDITATAPVRAAGVAPFPSDPDNVQCLRIGPLADAQLADTLRSSLSRRDVTTTVASTEGQIWVGHWVQLETVASRQEAEAIAARLAASGLPDAYILQTSPPFSISLGVFRDKERADKVAAEAARLGFHPQMTDRYRPGIQYWLTAVVPPGASLPADALGRESGQIVRSEATPCPADSIGGERAD